ncbi:hypothetical protein JXB11_01520 [Candidatus Woesearchaeota archaeon]|nr:hypothetical protein [Candidatus Woesearchaeota archaeon]
MKKISALILVSLLLVTIFSGTAFAADDDSMFGGILHFFSFKEFDDGSGLSREDAEGALTRIIVFVLIFAIFNAIARRLLGSGPGTMIALCIAAISTFFIPNDVLQLIGRSYGTAMAWLLMGGLIIGIGWLAFKAIPGSSALWLFVRLILLLLMIWLFNRIVGAGAIFNGS